jgi:hypothetical protein
VTRFSYFRYPLLDSHRSLLSNGRFWLLELCSQAGLSQSILRLMARVMYGTRPRPAFTVASLSWRVFFLHRRMRASSHRYVTRCDPLLSLRLDIRRAMFPVKRCKRYGTNLRRLVSVSRTANPGRVKSSRRINKIILRCLFYKRTIVLRV